MQPSFWSRVKSAWAAFREHPAIGISGGVVLLLAALANIWNAVSHDTVPQVLARRGWSMTWLTASSQFVLGCLLLLVGGQLLRVGVAVRRRQPVAASATNEWEARTDHVGRQLVFNLKNTRWGPPRETGFVSCVLQEPGGALRIASNPHPEKLPHDAAAYFIYPKDFVGASTIVNGQYRVRWETRSTPVAAPALVSEALTNIQGMQEVPEEPRAERPPMPVDLTNLTAERDALQGALRETQEDRERIRGLLGSAEQSRLTCKRQFALARITWFAQRVSMNIAKRRDEGMQMSDVHVTIRFALYEDLTLGKGVVPRAVEIQRRLGDILRDVLH